ncbi:hypothetical protein [Sulfitobacter sp.]|uniref:hypothetical protein n=1 Tax=Sulfitobacter sp. TaxID=1903071 RepID=UPI0040598DF4
MCNEIAIEREILAAKYNALIEDHNLDYRQEPTTVRRFTYCTIGYAAFGNSITAGCDGAGDV